MKKGMPGAFLTAIEISIVTPNDRKKQIERQELTVHDKLENKERHQRPLGVMHKVAIAHPLLGLGADLALQPGAVAGGDQLVAPKVVAEVLDDDAGFGQHQRLGRMGAFDGDDGGFS